MNGDFSRNTFRPRRHHSSVRLQQGRVQVDADWNEQVDIALHRDEVTTRDVIGPAGAPVGSDGFAIGMMTIPRRDPRARVPDGDGRASQSVTRARSFPRPTVARRGPARRAPPAWPRLAGGRLPVRDGRASLSATARRILATTDGGATWTRQTTPTGLTADLRAVAFRTASAGIAVGDEATVLSTTDGGADLDPPERTGGHDRRTCVRSPFQRQAPHLRSATTRRSSQDHRRRHDVGPPDRTDRPDRPPSRRRVPDRDGRHRGRRRRHHPGHRRRRRDWTRQTAPGGLTAHLRASPSPRPRPVSRSATMGRSSRPPTAADVDRSVRAGRHRPPAGRRLPIRVGRLRGRRRATILATADGGATWAAQTTPVELGIGPGSHCTSTASSSRTMTALALASQPDPPDEPAPSLTVAMRSTSTSGSACCRPSSARSSARSHSVVPIPRRGRRPSGRSDGRPPTGRTCADFGADWADAKAGTPGAWPGGRRPLPRTRSPARSHPVQATAASRTSSTGSRSTIPARRGTRPSSGPATTAASSPRSRTRPPRR